VTAGRCSRTRHLLPDPDVRAVVQRLAGYALTGDASEQVVLPVLVGAGANSKSTLVELLREALGGFAATGPTRPAQDSRDRPGTSPLRLAQELREGGLRADGTRRPIPPVRPTQSEGCPLAAPGPEAHAQCPALPARWEDWRPTRRHVQGWGSTPTRQGRPGPRNQPSLSDARTGTPGGRHEGLRPLAASRSRPTRASRMHRVAPHVLRSGAAVLAAQGAAAAVRSEMEAPARAEVAPGAVLLRLAPSRGASLCDGGHDDGGGAPRRRHGLLGRGGPRRWLPVLPPGRPPCGSPGGLRRDPSPEPRRAPPPVERPPRLWPRCDAPG